MSQQSAVVTLTSVSAYPSAPQFAADFKPDFFVFRLETGTPGLLVSFDGKNDHLHIFPNDPPVLYPTKAQNVWLKEDGAGASTWRVSALTRV